MRGFYALEFYALEFYALELYVATHSYYYALMLIHSN